MPVTKRGRRFAEGHEALAATVAGVNCRGREIVLDVYNAAR